MYPKWGNTRIAPQLVGGRHNIEKILSKTQGPAPHGQKEPKRPGQKGGHAKRHGWGKIRAAGARVGPMIADEVDGGI
jgi:hypothetical protein